jgi:hypothetical protein
MTRHDISVLATWVFACMVCIMLTGCLEDRFRYPCQDPKNWELDECKPPVCTATGTCPDQLTKPEKESK